MPFIQLIALVLIGYLPFRLGAARWLGPYDGLERVACSYAGGVILMFVAGMSAFTTGLPRLPLHALLLSALLLTGLLARAGVSRGAPVWPRAEEWRAVGLLGTTAAVVLLAQHAMTNYSGGHWSSDWYEHYERVLFFDGQLKLDHRFLTLYHLTARPPLFNQVACQWMTLTGMRFADYQVVATFLGSLVVLPVGLLLHRLARRELPGRAPGRTRALMISCALLLLNPMAVTHLLYPWTRMLACALVLLGLYLYLAAIFDGRRHLLAPAFVLMAAAHLTHYAADVVSVCVLSHYLWLSTRTAGTWRGLSRAATTLAPAAVLAGLWHAWAAAAYGAGRTVTATTTWQNLSALTPGRLAGQLYTNLLTTLVPFIQEKDPSFVRQMDPALRLYALYDHLHMYWTGTLVGAVSASALVAVCLAAIATRRRMAPSGEPVPARERRFLALMATGAFLISFLIVPGAEVSGIAHLTLQPVCLLVLLGVAAWVLQAGPWARTFFTTLYAAEALLFYYLKTLPRVNPTPTVPSALYTQHYYENLRLKLVTHRLDFLADLHPLLSQWSRPALLTLVPLLAGALWILLARPPAPSGGSARHQ
ncbi:MAG: hypothetical protein ACREAA_09260 [Candidatus Polarisedimenticolia bacterium]